MPEILRMNKAVYFGIDPGCSGGIAVLGSNGNLCEFHNLAFTDRHPWDWISQVLLHSVGSNGGSGTKYAVIEKNSGYVGGAGNPGSAMFKFGRSTGMLTGFLIAANIPYEEVTPQTWQKGMGIAPRKKGKGAETPTEFKRRLKSHAERLFPEAQVTLATCDALLIAEYCRRKREGKL